MVDEWEIDFKEPLISIFLWNEKPLIPHWKNTRFTYSLIEGSWRVRK